LEVHSNLAMLRTGPAQHCSATLHDAARLFSKAPKDQGTLTGMMNYISTIVIQGSALEDGRLEVKKSKA
jgi:hypothetical protein